MLRFSTVLLSGILAASINTAIPGIELPDPFASPGEVLRIYGYDRTAEKLLDDYYPDYVPDGGFREKEEGISVRYGNIGETRVIFTVVEDGMEHYEAYLDSVLLHGEDTPPDETADLFMLAGEELGKYCSAEADVALPLTESSFAELFENQYPMVRDAASDEDGALRAATMQVPCGAMLYRRSYAKEVFGTDDPDEIGKMAADAGNLTEMAEKLKEHGISFAAGPEETYDVFLSGAGPWVDENGTITISSKAGEWVRCMADLSAKGCIGSARRGSPEWKEALASDSGVFAFFMTSPEAVRHLSGNDEAPDDVSYGDWAVCRGPGAFIRGGTYIAASSDTDNRELAEDIIRTLTLDLEVLRRYTLDTGEMANNRQVMDELAKEASYGSALYGGQNDIAVFAAAADSLSYAERSPYDSALESIFLSSYLPYFGGGTEESAALSDFYGAVLERYPFLSDR